MSTSDTLGLLGAGSFLYIMYFIWLWGLFIWASAAIARSKGRSGVWWGLLAVPYGPVALLLAYVMPPQVRP